MDRALELARLALGATSPNPSVGAVVVRDGGIVGEGFTQPPGGDHAEIAALRVAADLARGAALFTTLEALLPPGPHTPLHHRHHPSGRERRARRGHGSQPKSQREGHPGVAICRRLRPGGRARTGGPGGD